MNLSPRPTDAQLAWSECEIGVIIHLDVQVFEPSYNFRRAWGYTPDPSVFNPTQLDTDQWIRTAKDAGAQYAVLVAKHCSGFSLWPTQAHDYSVKSSPWRDGKGDIVADFIASCEKFGLKPGIYCSGACNAYLNVDNPGMVRSKDPDEQARYNAILQQQLTELWGDYGKLFEIWFDGGVLPPEQGGPDIVPLLYKLQPDAVVFQGPDEWPSLLRHVGNERGCAPEPFWNTTNTTTSSDGVTEQAGMHGTPDGPMWIPGEADMPNRDQIRAFQGGWFWREGEDDTLYSLDHLIDCYFTSVGRNTNLLLGMVIDNRGLVPESDVARFVEFGQRVNQLLAEPCGHISGVGDTLSLTLTPGKKPSILCLAEDLKHGERVRAFVVEGKCGNDWITLWQGTNIGHKHLERFNPINCSELRLRITQSTDTPMIRQFSAWQVAQDLLPSQRDPAQRSRISIERDRQSMIHVTCDNPYLSITYTTDGSQPTVSSKRYCKPFALRDGGTIKAVAFLNDQTTSPVASATFGVDRSQWQVLSVSLESPYKNNGVAGSHHLLNDESKTYWHTYHADKQLSKPPHHVILKMDREISVAALTLMPHVNGGKAVAVPDDYLFELSLDGDLWQTAAQGQWTDWDTHPAMQVVHLEQPVSARYLRFTARHCINDVDYLAIAGIGVIDADGK